MTARRYRFPSTHSPFNESHWQLAWAWVDAVDQIAALWAQYEAAQDDIEQCRAISQQIHQERRKALTLNMRLYARLGFNRYRLVELKDLARFTKQRQVKPMEYVLNRE